MGVGREGGARGNPLHCGPLTRVTPVTHLHLQGPVAGQEHPQEEPVVLPRPERTSRAEPGFRERTCSAPPLP